jgi:hypothetical protein
VVVVFSCRQAASLSLAAALIWRRRAARESINICLPGGKANTHAPCGERVSDHSSGGAPPLRCPMIGSIVSDLGDSRQALGRSDPAASVARMKAGADRRAAVQPAVVVVLAQLGGDARQASCQRDLAVAARKLQAAFVSRRR